MSKKDQISMSSFSMDEDWGPDKQAYLTKITQQFPAESGGGWVIQRGIHIWIITGEGWFGS